VLKIEHGRRWAQTIIEAEKPRLVHSLDAEHQDHETPSIATVRTKGR
jgi:hypothetical protein